MNRRNFLRGTAILTCGLLPGTPPVSATQVQAFSLSAEPGQAQLVPEEYPATDVWGYNGLVPGPELRTRQGETLHVTVRNRLPEETTVHWHGIRLPNAMDGVPHVTQPPIAPGSAFTYEFPLPDAGTFWYHPHMNSIEQVGRGMYGALIVEEPDPPTVDRELVWILDDWRLDMDARIVEGFDNRHDLSHGGRIGNAVTINGEFPDIFRTRSGERIRLRLINAANSRIFALEFPSHEPQVIAIDGHPVPPHPADSGVVTLAPSMRMDLILDMTGSPGQKFPVVDRYYRQSAYRLIDLAYEEVPLRANLPDHGIQLPANPLPEPDPESAIIRTVELEGGAMGAMDGATLNGKWQDIRALVRQGKFWAINGTVSDGHVLDPLQHLKPGQSMVLDMRNNTAWPHVMHLHGHAFRVLARNGEPTRFREWQDSVLVERHETVQIAFVADSPGDWMFHCHMLGHQMSGMMSLIRIEA